MKFREEVFLAVAENLSFSKAANDLFISQPAVTKHIKELEKKYKTSLFERKGNKIFLTKAGKLAYSFFKQIHNQYRNFEFELWQLNESFKGFLRIGASSTIAQYLLPQILAAFHKSFPEIELFLFNGNSVQMEQKLLKDEIDLALVENASSHQDLKYRDFLNDEIVVVTGANSVYAKKQVLSTADLKSIPIVLREKGSGTLEVIKEVLVKNKLDPSKLNIFIHLGSTESIKNFLLNFDGIALISEKAIERELQQKILVKIPVKKINFQRKFRLALRVGQESQCAKLLIDFLFAYNF